MYLNRCGVSNGKIYYFGAGGKAEKEVSIPSGGWAKMPDGWHFVKSGNQIIESWMKIGGYYYYFDDLGIMMESVVWEIPDKENDTEGIYYRFDQNGRMVTGWYQGEDGTWFCYNENGSAKSGLQVVNGNTYYFRIDGKAEINIEFYYEGKLYRADGNGLCKALTGNGWVGEDYYLENGKPVTGWKKINDRWYYFFPGNGTKLSDGSHEINGKQYYFNSEGMMESGWIQREFGEWSYADPSGVLAIEQWYEINGKKYYFDIEGKMLTGLNKIGRRCQLFDKNGAWVKNVTSQGDGWIQYGTNWYYVESGYPVKNTSIQIDGKRYYFDMNGEMQRNYTTYFCYFGADGAAVVNQWRKEENDWIYYDESGMAVQEGWKKIGNNWYYFDNFRTVCRDRVISGKLYHFSLNGVSDGIGRNLSEGWNLIDGQYYYYQNGNMVSNCWKNIDSSRYYFDANGHMLYSQKMYDAGTDAYYFLDKNGKMSVGWCKYENQFYYAESDGKLIESGIHIISGKKYFFNDYIMSSSNTISEDGKYLYLINSNGSVTDTVSAYGNGWKKTSDGKWYYMKNGVFVRGHRVIDGKQYYFCQDGHMAVNTMIAGIGYAGADGSLQTNGLVNGYYLCGGFEQRGAHTINGKYYMFINAQRAEKGLFFVDGAYYAYDGNGSRSKVTLSEGWNKVYDDWYYVVQGKVCIGSERMIGIRNINGKEYYFDDYGRMRKNELVKAIWDYNHYKYLGSDGMPITGWKMIDNNWYYFDSNGSSLSGKHTINGKTYFFAKDGKMISGS